MGKQWTVVGEQWTVTRYSSWIIKDLPTVGANWGLKYTDFSQQKLLSFFSGTDQACCYQLITGHRPLITVSGQPDLVRALYTLPPNGYHPPLRRSQHELAPPRG
jgi:hypothetical protein